MDQTTMSKGVSPNLRDKKQAYINGLEDALNGMLQRDDLTKGIAALRKKIRAERTDLIRMG